MTAMPLGDVVPQVLEVLAVTNPGGKVRVTLPVLAGKSVAVVKDTVQACPDPWPRRPVRTGLDTHVVQGVSA